MPAKIPYHGDHNRLLRPRKKTEEIEVFKNTKNSPIRVIISVNTGLLQKQYDNEAAARKKKALNPKRMDGKLSEHYFSAPSS
ncbi:hypothetical protein ACVDG9_23770 [Roseibium sp. RP-7]